MLPELLERPGYVDPPKCRVIEGEAHLFQQRQYPVQIQVTYQRPPVGVEGVEGNPDGYGLTMPELAMGQLFQLVGRPVTEVQRP